MTLIETDSDPIDVALGMKVRLRRKALQMSQTALGDKVGVTFQQIQKYERGANRIAGSTWVRIAKALECRVADFYIDFDEGVDAACAMGEEMQTFMLSPEGHAIAAGFAVMKAGQRRGLRKVVDLIIGDEDDGLDIIGEEVEGFGEMSVIRPS